MLQLLWSGTAPRCLRQVIAQEVFERQRAVPVWAVLVHGMGEARGVAAGQSADEIAEVGRGSGLWTQAPCFANFLLRSAHRIALCG